VAYWLQVWPTGFEVCGLLRRASVSCW